MLALSFLLLLLVFRSILVPLKAVVMNLLSIGAAYGVIVAIFQWGWGAGVLGVSRAPIEAWVPMMLFAIVFGLSMDYEVFLLSSVREHYDRTRDNASAVAEGLASTARVITAAALIMVFVFGSFVVSDLRALKLIGLGLAVAVAVDAIDRPGRPRARDDGAARLTPTGGCRGRCDAASPTSRRTGPRHLRRLAMPIPPALTGSGRKRNRRPRL